MLHHLGVVSAPGQAEGEARERGLGRAGFATGVAVTWGLLAAMVGRGTRDIGAIPAAKTKHGGWVYEI